MNKLSCFPRPVRDHGTTVLYVLAASPVGLPVEFDALLHGRAPAAGSPFARLAPWTRASSARATATGPPT